MQRDYQTLCTQVVQIARRAAQYITQQRKSFSDDKIEYKGYQNLVSYVDKTAEKLIIDALGDLLPDSIFIAEESHCEPPAGIEANCDKPIWIIDPLDGTTNFTHGLPPYAVSIALMERGEIVIGVICEATSMECFWAWSGSECYLNDEVIRVSNIDSIERSLVITGLAYDTDNIIGQFARAFDHFNHHSNGTRRLGSAATDLAYIAAGRAECFFQQNLSCWDVAAGAFLVERAGGVVVDYQGGDNFIFGRSIIATNNKAHQEFYDTLCELS